MAHIGSAAAGKTLIGAGTAADPTFASIGTNSGLTVHGVLLAQGNSAFTALTPGSSTQVLTSNGSSSDPSYQALPSSLSNSSRAWALSTGVSNVTGDGTVYNVVYDVNRWTNGSDITLSGSTFTVNTTGTYLMAYMIAVKNLVSGQNQLISRLSLTSGGGAVYESNPLGIWNAAATGGINLATTVLLPLTASTTFSVQIQVSGGAKTLAISGVVTSTDIGRNYFAYFRIK